jgi:Sec-independent protein translocase protein TatA
MSEAGAFPWDKIAEYPIVIVLVYLLLNSYGRVDKLREVVTQLLIAIESLKKEVSDTRDGVAKNEELIRDIPDKIDAKPSSNRRNKQEETR